MPSVYLLGHLRVYCPIDAGVLLGKTGLGFFDGWPASCSDDGTIILSMLITMGITVLAARRLAGRPHRPEAPHDDRPAHAA